MTSSGIKSDCVWIVWMRNEVWAAVLGGEEALRQRTQPAPRGLESAPQRSDAALADERLGSQFDEGGVGAVQERRG